jgi:hypothetical protein
MPKSIVSFTNYNFRQTSIFFCAGINYTNSFRNKFTTIIFNSCGEVSYVPSRGDDTLFLISKFSSFLKIKNFFFKDLEVLKPFIKFFSVPFLLLQQEKNSIISLLELKPLRGVQYTRSIGSKSRLLRLDTRTGYSLVALSSRLKKIFSIFSLTTTGHSNLNFSKKSLLSTKCGDFRKKGLKSKVRGVAMNPIDHPHGGRTNSIKYQRTP